MNDCLKITFHLDGSGLYYDHNEPIHLDALMSWVNAPYHCTQKHLTREDVPELVPLPLYRHDCGNGQWVWCASALFPDGQVEETLRFWRKRFRQNRIEMTRGSPNLTNGIYRDWNMPMPLTLTHKMVAYARGYRREVLKCVKRIEYLGKKRAQGLGKVVRVEVERVEEDHSIYWEGAAMRWLPDDAGTRMVRLRPPYWNSTERVKCLEVGDDRNHRG